MTDRAAFYAAIVARNSRILRAAHGACTCAPHWDGPAGDCASCAAIEREADDARHEQRERDIEAANWSPGDDEPDYGDE